MSRRAPKPLPDTPRPPAPPPPGRPRPLKDGTPLQFLRDFHRIGLKNDPGQITLQIRDSWGRTIAVVEMGHPDIEATRFAARALRDRADLSPAEREDRLQRIRDALNGEAPK